MGKPSMEHQVRMIADAFDGRGESKYQVKQLARELGKKPSDLTRDKVYAQSSRMDFIDDNSRFANYCKHEFNISKLAQIKPEHFTKYWNDHFPKWALPTRAKYLNEFIKLSYYLEQKGWGRGFVRDDNRPVVKGYKRLAIRTDRAKAWDRPTFNKLQSEIDPVFKNVTTVLVEVGIRAIEMQRLKLKDVDFEKKELAAKGKGARPRTLPLTDEAIKALKAEITRYEIRNPNDKVFAHINTKALRNAIAYFNRKYSLPKRSLHSIRHTYAKEWFAKKYKELRLNGMSIEEARRGARAYVSHLLGHGNVRSDMGRISVTYAYISKDEAKEIIDEIEKELSL